LGKEHLNLGAFSGGEWMPVYEFECKKCKQIFEVVMTMAEAVITKVACPICTCEDVQQQFSPFAAVTSRKS
jgi:putative FmdB family regulatory protein